MALCSIAAGAAWVASLTKLLAWLALGSVAILLIASLVQQFRMLGPRGRWLDALALVPQWKFFGQDAVGRDPAWSDDWYLVARVAPQQNEGQPGPWQNVLGPAERTWWHFAWNPQIRSQAQLLVNAELIARAETMGQVEPTSLAYLSALRACFEAVAPIEDEVLQFAVVATRGRDGRTMALQYLSPWHAP